MAERYTIPIPPLSDRDIARFWSKVRKAGPDECWMWTANPGPNGYGLFHMNWRGLRRMYTASRVAFTIVKGDCPPNHIVRHTCDTPGCVNPAHLISGTQADNSRDCVERGRNVMMPGETNPNSKLSTENVMEIRRRYQRGNAIHLAREFGISNVMVGLIVKRRSWRHI